MRIRVERLGEGLHPSEVVVGVRTANGRVESVVVDRDLVTDDTLEVGYPVGQRNGSWLVELPRETMTGAWRVWLSPNQTIEEQAA